MKIKKAQKMLFLRIAKAFKKAFRWDSKKELYVFDKTSFSFECSVEGYGALSDFVLGEFSTVARNAREKKLRAHGWISTIDRLPLLDEGCSPVVLILIEGGCKLGRFKSEAHPDYPQGKYVVYTDLYKSGSLLVSEVSHWQPLPKPPE